MAEREEISVSELLETIEDLKRIIHVQNKQLDEAQDQAKHYFDELNKLRRSMHIQGINPIF